LMKNPTDIAGHFSVTYKKIFNTDFRSSREKVEEILGGDINY